MPRQQTETKRKRMRTRTRSTQNRAKARNRTKARTCRAPKNRRRKSTDRLNKDPRVEKKYNDEFQTRLEYHNTIDRSIEMNERAIAGQAGGQNDWWELETLGYIKHGQLRR